MKRFNNKAKNGFIIKKEEGLAIKSFIKVFLVSLAALFIVFQPVLVPVSHAVESWTGDSWEGESWEGNSWDGSGLKWKGKSWSNDGWSGDKWNGEGTDGSGTVNGDGWNGQNWESQPWYMRGWNGGNGFDGDSWEANGWDSDGTHTGDNWRYPGWTGAASKGDAWSESGFQGQGYHGDPWSQNGYAGDPWSQNGYQANGYAGDPWSQNGYQANGYAGNPWSQNGYQGNGYSGNPWDAVSSGANAFSGQYTNGNGYETPDQFYDSDDYKYYDYAVNDIVKGSVNVMDDGFPTQGTTLFGTDLLVNGMKMYTGDDHGVYDAYDMTRKAYDGVDAYGDLDQIRKTKYGMDAASQTTQSAKQITTAGKSSQFKNTIMDSSKQLWKNTDVSKMSGTWSNMSAVSKFNGVTSAISAGVSAYKTGVSIGNAYDTITSDAPTTDKVASGATVGENIGETLMSAGGVAAAIPGGQAVGAGLAVAGAGIYVVSKGTKLVAENWDTIKSKTKETVDTVKNAASKGWSKVKGWFS